MHVPPDVLKINATLVTQKADVPGIMPIQNR